MTFFLAAAWGLVILVGLVGWGDLLVRILRPARPLPPGVAAAIGFAFSTIVGGLLGLIHAIRPPVVIAFVLLGVSAAIASHRGKSPRARHISVLAILLWAVVAFRYAGAVKTVHFQPLDDIPAYLVYPIKMLQTGCFAPDPFSDRRLNGLGGQPWSQSLVLCLFDPSTVNLFDHGVMFLVLILLIGQWMESIGLSVTMSRWILLVFSLFYPVYLNCASFLSITAEIFCLFVLLEDGPVDSIPRAILIALVTAALCDLKTTGIPFCGAILAVYFLSQCLRRRSPRPPIMAAVVAGMVFVLLLPWMIAMRQSSGTPLFPLLGNGYSQMPSVIGTTPPDVIWSLVFLAIFTAAVAVVVRRCTRSSSSARSWGALATLFMLVAAPVTVILGMNTGGVSWMRYSQPPLIAMLPFPLAALAISGRKAEFVAVACLFILLPIGWLGRLGPLAGIGIEAENIRASLPWRPPVSAEIVQRIQRLQASAPPGVPILARLDWPESIDFTRNIVYVTDHPGLAGPPPGVPQPTTAANLADYLLHCGIRYVAYSQFFQANRPGPADLKASPYFLDQLAAERGLGFQNALDALSRRAIFNDGADVMIDLDQGN